MSKTIEMTLEETPQVIADSNDYTAATIQVRGNHSAEIIVDERTDAQRATDGDTIGVIYKPMERALFQNWTGQIRGWAPYGDKKTTITVILS